MALHKLKDFYPNYHDQFGDHDILGYDLYSGNEKIGSIDDLLVDDEGKFRYLIVNTGMWIFGKKVMLPIGRSRIDYGNRRVYADGLTRDQVENLPEYDSSQQLDYDQEERVRGVYRSSATPGMTNRVDRSDVASTTPVDTRTSLDATPGLRDRDIVDRDRPITPGVPNQDITPGRYDRDTYRYDRDPDLFNLNDRDHQNLRLYEERLIADKTRQKTGEVVVGKRIETEQAHVSVPIERERVVIERTAPVGGEAVVDPGADAFRDSEVARVEVFEETPDIRKETVVREEINVSKVVDRDTAEVDDTVRRERLDVQKEGNPVIRDDEPRRTDRL